MKLVPFFTTENNELFAKMPAHLVEIEGVIVESAPLAFDRVINLIGLSMNRQLLDNGIVDHTDCLGTDARIPAFHFRISNKNIPNFPEDGILYTSNVPTSAPLFVMGESSRHLVLDSHVTIPVPNASQTVPIGELKVHFFGQIALEMGTCYVSAKPTLTMPDGDGWVCEMVGYDLDIDRVNPNRRPQ